MNLLSYWGGLIERGTDVDDDVSRVITTKKRSAHRRPPRRVTRNWHPRSLKRPTPRRTRSPSGSPRRRNPTSRAGEGNCRFLLQKSFHSSDHAVSRLLQLLHLPQRSRPTRSPFHDAR